MRSALIVALAVALPLFAAGWTLLQMRRAGQRIGSAARFEGMHFED